MIATWGEHALEEMRRDPYQLAELVDGLPLEHPSRIRAGLEHLLAEARGEGHCYVPAGKLIAMAARLLNVQEAAVLREGRAAIAAGRLVQREVGVRCTVRVYVAELDAAEQAVADSVRRLVRGASVARKEQVHAA